MLVKKFLYWLPMPVIGVVNGVLRQTALLPFLDEFIARQVSAVLLVIFLTIYVNAVWRRLGIRSAREAWMTGLIWVLLTMIFEFSLGYFVSGLTFGQMWAEYDLFAGKLWALVLIALLILPPIFHRMRR